MPTFSNSYFCAPNIWLRALGVHIVKLPIGSLCRQMIIVQSFPVYKKPEILVLGYIEPKYVARASGNTLW